MRRPRLTSGRIFTPKLQAEKVLHLYEWEMLNYRGMIPNKEWYDWVAVERAVHDQPVGRKLSYAELRAVTYILHVEKRQPVAEFAERLGYAPQSLSMWMAERGIPLLAPIDQVGGVTHLYNG